MTTTTSLATVPVQVIPIGVSGTKKRAGRQPSNFRLQAIEQMYGSQEKYNIALQSMSKTERLVSNDDLSKLTQKLKSFAKNGGKPGLRGRQPGEARQDAVRQLFNMSYADWRAHHDTLSDDDKVAESAKVTALTCLLETGVTLDADEAGRFMGLDDDEIVEIQAAG